MVILRIWFNTKGGSTVDAEVQRIHSRFKDSLIKVSQLPPAREGEVVVIAVSIDDLAKTGYMALKPILYYKGEDGRSTYNVIDGNIRYQYTP